MRRWLCNEQRFLGLIVFLLALLPFTVAADKRIKAEPSFRTPVTLSPAAWAALDLATAVYIDYGAFIWTELSEAELDRVARSGYSYQSYPEAYMLDLGGIRFDTRAGAPTLPAGLDQVSSQGPDLHLVQLQGPTRQEWLETLQLAGLEIVQYIHPHSYVVWGEAPAAALAGQTFVGWTGPFAPAYRLLPAYRSLVGEMEVHLLLYRSQTLADTVAELTNLAGALTSRATLNATWEMVNVRVDGSRLVELANVPGVYSVQPVPTDGGLRGEMSNQINVNNHAANNAAFPGYTSWLAAAGVDGSGVIMANVDGGIQDNHPDLVNRMVSCSGDTCGGGASDSHGTHTAGIMAADGASGTVDGNGFLRGLGMAPGANLVEQVYSPWFTQAGGMLKLITESYANNALLSGNSWGPSGSPLGYDDDTLQVDIGVRDADAATAGNQEFSYVLSFMNGNGGTSSQGTPDEAKNIFTIGSTKMQLSNGNQDLNINDISANSAHGPALDGRTIPHMVAPGCRVDSTVTGSGYGLSCGTSMASPHVSGAVALFIQYYRDLFATDPSPALVKAAFLPVAHDLAGFDDADGGTLGHPFDSKQGWGRLDVAAVVSPTVAIVYVDQTVVLDNSGEEWTGQLAVADPAEPVRLMLVWTDAPGHGLGGSTPAWNNDLNLTVTVNGSDYVGNNFGADGWSQTGGSYDGMNNTEGVFLTGVSGNLIVTVAGANINSDGVPGVGDGTDQDFALVCYNCLNAPIEYTEFIYLPAAAKLP